MTYNSLLPYRLPTAMQGVYSELLQLLQFELTHAGPPPEPRKAGVHKVVKGHTYWYWQWRDGKKMIQKYIGKDSDPKTHAVIAAGRLSTMDQKTNIAAVLRGMFGNALNGPMGRVLLELGAAGLAKTNAVVVGTYAFIAYQGMFAIKWPQHAMTEDIDLAAWPVAGAFEMDLFAALQRTNLGFEPARQLDTADPPVLYVVPRTLYRVDVLTPLLGRIQHVPIHLASMGCHAAPLRFLDYLIDEPELAAFPVGNGVLVRVPAPGRYALHKLLIASRRQTGDKRQKDVAQAQTLLAMLVIDNPAEIQSAWRALKRKPKSWANEVVVQLRSFPGDLRAELGELIGVGL